MIRGTSDATKKELKVTRVSLFKVSTTRLDATKKELKVSIALSRLRPGQDPIDATKKELKDALPSQAPLPRCVRDATKKELKAKESQPSFLAKKTAMQLRKN